MAQRVAVNSRRGSLAAVLLWAGAVSVFALCLASALLTHYNLAARYRDQVSMELWARGGVQEFLLRASQLQADASASGAPQPLLQRFATQPVLLQRGDVRVSLLLDGAEKSTDNSLGAAPVPSSFDQAGQRTVPPFSYALALRVERGRDKQTYEALVQQRWPYALAAPGPIHVVGKIHMTGGEFPNGGGPSYAGSHMFSSASLVKGDILATAGPAAVVPGSVPWVTVPFPMYEQVLTFSQGSTGANQDSMGLPAGQAIRERLKVGGPVFLYKNRDAYLASDQMPFWIARCQTTGALVDGSVHLYDNSRQGRKSPDYIVASDSTVSGLIHENYRPGGADPLHPDVAARLARLFETPDLSGFTPTPNPATGRQSAVKDIVISSGAPSSQSGDKVVVQGTRLRIQGNLEPGHRQGQAGSLTLQDCSLAVEGDVRLEGDLTDQRVLQGSNASLIVKGSLIVDNGEMEAGGSGMVIYCHRFVIKAKGSYKGVIIARDGGTFFGAALPGRSGSPQTLNVLGGVLIGANELVVAAPEDAEGSRLPNLDLGLCGLASVRLEYGPQYMRSLNQFGALRMLALQRRVTAAR